MKRIRVEGEVCMLGSCKIPAFLVPSLTKSLERTRGARVHWFEAQGGFGSSSGFRNSSDAPPTNFVSSGIKVAEDLGDELHLSPSF